MLRNNLNLRTVLFAVLVCAFLALSSAWAGDNKVMGELQFSGATKVERDSGVWIDGQYLGYLKELKGDKKVMLLPGEHEVIVRQSGYQDFTQHIVCEPGQTLLLPVKMEKDPSAKYPSVTAELRIDIKPERAAVFLDDAYVGHAQEFTGAFHYMLISPGKHRIKVELPGYRTFETELNLLANQKSEVKTELVKGSVLQSGALVKQP